MKRYLVLAILVLANANVLTYQSGIYWVSATGTALWDDCESASPLSGASACPMSQANLFADVGDTVNLRGGTYNTQIKPSNSGTLEDRVTYQGYLDETVEITDVGNLKAGIDIDAKDYIVVTKVWVHDTYILVLIHNGSSYNEISHSLIETGLATANNGFNIFTVIAAHQATPEEANTHNWVHHNTIRGGGYVSATPPSPNGKTVVVGCDDAGGLINVGGDNTFDGLSDYNTFEDNEIYWGAHHAFKFNTRHNVVRNNFMHNEGHFPASLACQTSVDDPLTLVNPDFRGTCTPTNDYGNRVLHIVSNHVDVPEWYGDTFNLIENNRIGGAYFPADGNGADGLTLGGENDIARYNIIYNSTENGIYTRSSTDPGDGNHVYNNTIVNNGNSDNCRILQGHAGFWQGGVRIPAGADNNKFLNNIIYGNYAAVTGGESREFHNKGAGTVNINNWRTATGTFQGDPKFVNADYSVSNSLTTPDLNLTVESGAIDAGAPLTQANGASSEPSVTLVVDDALFFQDGTRGSDLSDIQADWIAIGSTTNEVQIANIDYDTNTITLISPKTWEDNANIWLTRKSDGEIVLLGGAPDIGAAEFNNGAEEPSAPTSGRAIRRRGNNEKW